MTQEQKELLIKDLCDRLPYGVQVQDTRCGISGKLHDMLVFPLYEGNDVYDYIATTNFYSDCYYDDIELFKPYLFPLSSITNQQLEKLQSYMIKDSYGILYHTLESYDYLYRNNIDVRGLIPMGLAIDATDKNIY